MTITKLPLSWFVDKLNQQEPFSFVRYGDGEFAAMFHYHGQNCDGTVYTKELGEDLKQTLAKPRDYLYAIGPRALRLFGREIAEFQKVNHLAIQWYSTETFLEASLAGELFPFVEALRKRKVMFVAPDYLRKFSAFDMAAFVGVPPTTAYQFKDRIRSAILREAYQADVILFSAGMASKILIWELYRHFGQTHTLIDCGSLWDMYAGHDSRGYARKMSAARKAELFDLNFRGAKELA